MNYNVNTESRLRKKELLLKIANQSNSKNLITKSEQSVEFLTAEEFEPKQNSEQVKYLTSMVLFNRQALTDLDHILIGLLTWQKIDLSVEYCHQYIDEIIEYCLKLENSIHHIKTTYRTHQKYGTNVYPLQRNHQTTWYIIYDIIDGDIYIQHIISNYKTTIK